MKGILIFIAAVLFIGVLVYLRYMAKRHVAALFYSSVQKAMEEGMNIEEAMRGAVGKLRRRPPFSSITEDELQFFLDTLQDLDSPADVAAQILQSCERKKQTSDLKNPATVIHLAYATDLKLTLRHLIESAKLLQKRLSERYPNITIALLASLSVRDGWAFVEEQKDTLVYKYRGETVRLFKRESGKDVARRILFEEAAQRPLPLKPNPGYEIRKSGRRAFVEKFDHYFDEAFQGMAN